MNYKWPIIFYPWITERCTNLLAWWKSSNGRYRTILAAITTATCSHTAAITE